MYVCMYACVYGFMYVCMCICLTTRPLRSVTSEGRRKATTGTPDAGKTAAVFVIKILQKSCDNRFSQTGKSVPSTRTGRGRLLPTALLRSSPGLTTAVRLRHQ